MAENESEVLRRITIAALAAALVVNSALPYGAPIPNSTWIQIEAGVSSWCRLFGNAGALWGS
ncbi:MAG TPA: hypothetical protein VEJ16_16860 [Alphaproteobacteria bacterium]|jgi:hypothetical protein|nr:hypothetical protein [Alphaproteobacteria bacterium]